mgnify:CR=1 FL=1
MYVLLAISMGDTTPGDQWRGFEWESYGFFPPIRYTDVAHIEEAVRTQKPDAVFLDMDGLDDVAAILGEIDGARDDCLCVVISSDADPACMRRAMRAGAFDFCVKPVTGESLAEILCALRERLDERAKCPPIRDERLAGIIAYMEAHLSEKLSLTGIAGAFHMSKNYLCSYFKTHTGVNFVDYLTSLRIDKAKGLLSSNMSLDEIAEKTGFSDAPYFIKVFKKREGISPGAYRRSTLVPIRKKQAE